MDFWRISNNVLNNSKSVIIPLLNSPEVLSSASDKARLFAKNFSKNSNHDGSCISLPVFYSTTNLKLYNISVTPKMVKKVTTNLDSLKGSVSDCIPVFVLKNSEPELSYILFELFNICLKNSYFQIVGLFHRWSLYLRMFGKSLLLKTTALLIFFLWLVKFSKIL